MSLRIELDRLAKALSYDTAPDPPCSTFCSDVKDCVNKTTTCLYRRGHHIFSWGDVIARRNECGCDSMIFEDNPKKYKAH